LYQDQLAPHPREQYPEAAGIPTLRESSMLEFKALGPLVVLRDDEPIAITGINQRAALGYLLLHPDQVVATSELLHALWGDRPPPTARKILQNAISSLRRVLTAGQNPDEAPVLVTQPPGYLLRTRLAGFDLGRFRDLARVGQLELTAGDWDEAERHLRDALALWRGPALADLAEAGFAWPELAALQNARIAALENRMEAALAAGRHLEIVDELEAFVHGGPLRERLSRQLMLALYRSGRQVDALRLYQRIRSALVNQLGLDPSPELRELERAILDHDPALHPAGDAVIRLTGGRGLVPAGEQHAIGRAGSARTVPAGPRVESPGDRRPAAADARRGSTADAHRPATGGERAGAELRWVTAVLVRWETSHPAPSPDVLERLVTAAERMVRHRIHDYGGQSVTSLGQVQVALFGAAGVGADDAECALRAAIAINEQSTPELRFRIAVSSGEGLVRPLDGSRPSTICGHFLDAGLDLLRESGVGTVRVCDSTQALCVGRFDFTTAAPDGGYQLVLPGRAETVRCPDDAHQPGAVRAGALDHATARCGAPIGR
jgi:DNA-binding SARP family transcriptional activator